MFLRIIFLPIVDKIWTAQAIVLGHLVFIIYTVMAYEYINFILTALIP